jgi:glycosyltransferase involved in cell wall biosynthesis
VIPARNEERYLARLLDTVEEAAARYRGGPEAIEIVVSDNVSTDGTAALARRRGARVVAVEKRRIGAVRNGGARAARGEIVCFVDADFRIHPETFNVIEDSLTGGVVAGTTGARMERMSLGIAAIYSLLVAAAWLTSMDTGVIFCRRADFDRIAGYREDMLVAEDVWFLWTLRRLGRGRGQKLVRARGAKAVASARKFDEHGDWHYITNLVRSVYWVLFDRPSLRNFAERYWYRARG